MKRVKFILGAVLVVVLFSGLYATNHRIDQLEAKLEEKEEQKVEVTQQVEEVQEEEISNEQVEYDTVYDYIERIFPTDGNYYVEKTGTIQFYADPDCTIKIDNPRFVSKEAQYHTGYITKAGYSTEYYVLRMEENKVCYCPANTTRPKLIKVN